MFWTILDEERRNALPALGFCRNEGFYLAGGTALALQIGHRDSVDFDFFKGAPFDTARLFDHLLAAFPMSTVVKVQDERNTLTVIAAGNVKLSFMSYPYPLLRPLVAADGLDLADIADIGCMRLSAITGRATLKDYVDLYFVLQGIPLTELLDLCAVNLPQLDRALIVKAMTYFDDLDDEPVRYMPGKDVSLVEVRRFLIERARQVY